MMVAASAACSFADSVGEDTLVVVDHLGGHLRLWRTSCEALLELGVVVQPEEEGSQQRAYYARLVERASRRKAGGSLTLLLLQPSVSVLTEDEGERESYTVDDFADFSQRVQARVQMLADKGIELSEEVLVKVGIPLPGSDHPSTGKGQRSAQHLEELTSLVDGHIDLRENLAAAGRVPPLDPANSLTRIGVGSNALRPLSASEAMRSVTRALRLELAAASDPVHIEEAQARRAGAYLATLQQPSPTPMPLAEEVALLLAASEGLLDEPIASRSSSEAVDLLSRLLCHLRAECAPSLDLVTRKGLLSDSAAEELRDATAAFIAGQ